MSRPILALPASLRTMAIRDVIGLVPVDVATDLGALIGCDLLLSFPENAHGTVFE